MSQTGLKSLKHNVGIYQTKNFQNKKALISTKHCQVWQIMVIREHFIAKFRVFKLLPWRFLANLSTRTLEVSKLGDLNFSNQYIIRYLTIYFF